MGRTNRQRRADRQRRAEHERLRSRDRGTPSTAERPAAAGAGHAYRRDPLRVSESELQQLVVSAALLATTDGLDSVGFQTSLKPLIDLEIDQHVDTKPSHLINSHLERTVATLYEAGWQPADVAHAVRRKSTVRAGRLIAAVIAADARTSRAADRAPQPWLDQLAGLGVYNDRQHSITGGHGRAITHWARSEQLRADEMLTISLGVLGHVMRSPKLQVLLPPPSRWGASNKGLPPRVTANANVDAKTLGLIRALLAKAEATNFEAEAEAFTAKAQDMMKRYSIDAAFVAASADRRGMAAGIESRRVHMESPYAEEKATFLSVVARVNTVRAIWIPDVGFTTLMGFPVDLDLTELLFTSLLVQATRASAEATTADRRLRTASFRRAFLISFARRIGERLTAAGQQASIEAEEHYGGALVPVLAAKEEAIDQAYATAFPNSRPMRAKSFDARGWHAGRAAADRAHIKTGEAIGRAD
jgi:Protein of unknown function (DUF2786)